MPTTQEILDAARQRLYDLLTVGVAEYSDGAQRARNLELSQVRETVADMERRLAAETSSNFRMGVPLRRR